MVKARSENSFRKLITKRWDNSTGDHNHLPFDFIDQMGLQKEFKQYLYDHLKANGVEDYRRDG